MAPASEALRTLTPTLVRRLFLAKQRLAGPRPEGEVGAPTSLAAARAVAGAIEDLAQFLGARQIAYGTAPNAWKRALR